MSGDLVPPLYAPNGFPHFESPGSPEFYHAMYAVVGKDRAENHLITIAQDQFLSCWLSDPYMTTPLDNWRASISLEQIIDDIANFLDRVAERYGFSHRAELGHTPCPPNTPIEDLLPEWYGLQDRLYAAYGRAIEVGPVILQYVRDEVQQPWLWLAFRLTCHLFQEAWERAMGITLVHQRVSYLDDYVHGPFVQPSEILLKTKDGEPLPEARRRLMAEARAFCANLQPIKFGDYDLPKGKVRQGQEQKIRQYARWLYLHLVHKKTPNDLARTFHTERQEHGSHQRVFRTCACRQDVKYGLEQACRLLNLATSLRES